MHVVKAHQSPGGREMRGHVRLYWLEDANEKYLCKSGD